MFLPSAAVSGFTRLEPYYGTYRWHGQGGAILITASLGFALAQPLWFVAIRRGGGDAALSAAIILLAGAAFGFTRSAPAGYAAQAAFAFVFGAANGGVGTALWSSFAEAASVQRKAATAFAFALLTATSKIGLAIAGLCRGAAQRLKSGALPTGSAAAKRPHTWSLTPPRRALQYMSTTPAKHMPIAHEMEEPMMPSLVRRSPIISNVARRLSVAVALAVCLTWSSVASAGCVWTDLVQPQVRAAVVKPAAAHLNFVEDAVLKPGCPNGSAGCKKRSYVVSGDVVLIGPTQGAYTCAGFQGVRGFATIGWLPTAALAILPGASQAPLDWSGHWAAPEQDIVIKAGAGGALTVAGEASWGMGDAWRRQNGAVHTGFLNGKARPVGGILAFTEGDGRTLGFAEATRTAAAHGCGGAVPIWSCATTTIAAVPTSAFPVSTRASEPGVIGLPLLALLASAGPCSAGGEFEPPLCPTGLPPVTRLHITAQDVRRWKETGPTPNCPRFRLTEAQAERFFRGARSVDSRDVHYTLPESPCVVRGSVVFADGSRGSWQVDSFALGWLDRPHHPRLTLYCRNCESAPWMQ